MNAQRAAAATILLATGIVLCLLAPWLIARADAPGGIYAMNSFNSVPGGAMGATLYFTWAELNPSPGLYTWGPLERQLAAHAGRPVQAMFTVSRSGWYGDYLYIVDSAAWAGQTHAIPIAGKTMRLPAYDNEDWRKALQTFVGEFGARYDGDPRISSIVVTTGLDNETHAYKSDYESYVAAALGTGFRPAFERYVKEALVWFDTAFPTTPLYVAANPGGQAFRRDIIRNYLLPLGIGYKNCGLQIDHPTAWGPASYLGSGGNYALWAPMRDLQGLTDLWLESTTGTNATAELVYWSLLMGMAWKPAGIDLHKEYFAANPDAIEWANTYLDDPGHGVWIVFRDAEYGAYSSSVPVTSTMYLSGWPGDFGYGITRTTEATRLLRASLPSACRDQIESRQARQFLDGMTLVVADPATLGRRVTVRVCYLDRNATFTLSIDGQTQTLGGGATRRFTWATWQQDVSASWDGQVRFEGEGTLHMVEITRGGTAPDVATATPVPTFAEPDATATPTPTMTVTPTATPTATATASPTPCPDQLVLDFATRLGIRDTAGEWLYTTEPGLDWLNDPTLDGTLGAPLSAAFEWGPYLCRAHMQGILVIDDCSGQTIIGWDGEVRE